MSFTILIVSIIILFSTTMTVICEILEKPKAAICFRCVSRLFVGISLGCLIYLLQFI